MVVMPRCERVLDLLRADEMDVRVDAARGDDQAFAGDHFGGRADDDRDARLDTGFPALPTPAMRPSLMPMSALTMPQWSRISALVITRSTRIGVRSRWPWPMPSRIDLAAAEFDFLAIDASGRCSISIHSSVSPRRTRSPRGGTEHLRVGAARDDARHVSGPHDAALESVYHPIAGERHEFHLAMLARLEAYRGAGRDVQPEAARVLAVELQRADWSHKNDSANPPGSADRRVLATVIRAGLAPRRSARCRRPP